MFSSGAEHLILQCRRRRGASIGDRGSRMRVQRHRVPVTGEEHRDLAFLRRHRRAWRRRDARPRKRLEKLAGTTAVQVLHGPVVRQDLHLIVREGDGEKSVAACGVPSPADVSALARACGTGGPMVAVGDVELRNRRERARRARRARRRRRATTVCRTPSGACEVEERRARRRACDGRRRPPPTRDRSGTPGPVCALISIMWRVRSSSLSRRVFSCFLMTSRSYSSTEKQAATPVCTWAPICSRYDRALGCSSTTSGACCRRSREVVPRRLVDDVGIRIGAARQIDLGARDCRKLSGLPLASAALRRW